MYETMTVPKIYDGNIRVGNVDNILVICTRYMLLTRHEGHLVELSN